jgi:hypothetical protein
LRIRLREFPIEGEGKIGVHLFLELEKLLLSAIPCARLEHHQLHFAGPRIMRHQVDHAGMLDPALFAGLWKSVCVQFERILPRIRAGSMPARHLPYLHQDRLHQFSMHIGEAKIAALETIRQLLMIETELDEGAWRAGRARELCSPPRRSRVRPSRQRSCRAYPTARDPHGEKRPRDDRVRPLRAPRPSACGQIHRPHDQRVLQQSPLFQIQHECGARPIDFAAALFQRGTEVVILVAVVIPIRVIELHKPHAAFDSRRASRQLLAKDGFPGSAP